MLSGKNTDRSCMFSAFSLTRFEGDGGWGAEAGGGVKERAKQEDRLSQQRVERELSLNSVTSLIM